MTFAGEGARTVRTVTIVFTDIEGSTEVATVRGEGVAREIRRIHDSVVRSQLRSHRGREVKSLGDGLIAEFASVRDALTATAAMQQQLERHNRDEPRRTVRVRIGMHTGEVTDEDGDLFGEAVNAAQRIAAKAKGGEILVSDVCRRLVRHVFGCSFRDRGRHHLKGFPERWQLFELRCDTCGEPPSQRTAFVARDELVPVTEALQRAAVGHGGVLLVAGEAGTGKSRLCEEAASATGLQVLRGAATVRPTGPYGPFAALLRSHLRRDPSAFAGAGPLNAHLAALLPELGSAPPEGHRDALVVSLTDALRSLCRHDPAVILLDDLQWADAATLELVSVLASAARGWPLAVLGIYRSDEVPRGHPIRQLRYELRRAGALEEVTVGPLDEPSTARLAANVLGQEPGPLLRAAVFDRTQGVPFFVEELVTALRSAGSLVPVRSYVELEEQARIPIPVTVRDAVRLRLDGMSHEARSTLEAAAVAGSVVSLDVLATLGDDAGADEVIEVGVLVETAPGTCAFRHDLVRESVYADTTWSRRRALHRELAQLLGARGEEPRLVADHWLAAGDRDRARPLLLEAARRFMQLHAARDAARAIRDALDLWPDGEDEARRDALRDLGRCAQRCGDLAEAVTAWEEAATLLDRDADPGGLADLRSDIAAVYELLGRSGRAVAARTDAGALYSAADRPAEAAAVRLLAVQQLVTADPMSAMSLADGALDAARSARRSDLEARALALRGLVVALGGERDDGMREAREALGIALSAQHLDAATTAHWVLGTIANHWADYDGAQETFDAAVELCRLHDRRSLEQLCVSCMAIVAYNRGDWAGADRIARDVLGSDARPAVRAHALLVRGLIGAARGATKRARSLLDEALAAAIDPEASSTAFQANGGLALIDELEGCGSARWATLIDTPITVLRQNHGWWLSRAATSAARRRDDAMVRRCADLLASWSSRFAGSEGVSAMAHVLGEMALLEGDFRGAAQQYGRALEVLAGLSAPFEVAHTRMRAGVALARAGDKEAGVSLLTDAYRTFRRLGARPFCLLVATDLEGLGEQIDRRLGRRAATASATRGLTPRELDVLQRVAMGQTNREIATDLFVSVRTVDMHVRNVLTKLGCKTRTEAAARAHALGLVAPPT